MSDALISVEQQLKKKGTFEQGVRNLERFFEQGFEKTDEGGKQEALRLLGRTATLLKSRYSSLAFWKTGLKLFESAQAAVAGSSVTSAVNDYVQSAQDFITDTEGGAGPSEQSGDPEVQRQSTTPSLFQGQLSMNSEPPPPPAQDLEEFLSHLIVPELLEDSPNPALNPIFVPSPNPNSQQEPQNPNSQQETQNPNNSTTQENTGENENNGNNDEMGVELENIQARILEALDAMNSGVEAVLRGMERVEQGVQEVLQAVRGDGDVPSPSPPAAKAVVEALPRKCLKNEDLETLGDQATCPVCIEAFKCGHEMTCLPCKHVFHLHCLKKWLAVKNSCPLCRHELPTDDWKYEMREEREEERRGAANALSHNEFMYI